MLGTDPVLRKFKRPPLPTRALAEFTKVQSWLSKSDAPLFVEVGCGVGLHPIRWSQQNPDARLLAFERTEEKFAKAERRFNNNGAPENLCIAHADAMIMLPYLIKPKSVYGFYFLYPNPYPKHSQANLRLAHSPFLHFVRESLAAGGKLVLATNSRPYAYEVEKILPSNGFTLEEQAILPKDFTPRTHFERKYLERGESCFNFVFRI